MSSHDSVVDRSKLTQRELLLLLAEKMDTVQNDVESLKTEYPTIRDRLTRLETKIYVVGMAFGAAGVILTLIINFYNTIK